MSLSQAGWTVIEAGGGQIGFREYAGCFFVGSYRAEGRASAILVQRIRVIARNRGYTRMYWQMLPETGFKMMKTLQRGRARLERIDGGFLNPNVFLVRSLTISNKV